MSKQWTWCRPASLEEAVELLLAHGDDAVPIAGGTSLCLNPPRWEKPVLIDLQAVGLDSIDTAAAGAVKLGAMVTARTLAAAPSLDAVGSGMLREASAWMGPQPVRNRVTLGGNVMQVFRWCNLPVALLALDARFGVAAPGGARREIGADDLLAMQPRKSLKPGELLASVTVTTDASNQGGAFVRLAQTAVDHALITAAARVTVEGDRCSAARVVVGALAVLPERLPAVEAALIGRPLAPATIAGAAAAAAGATVHADRRLDEPSARELAVVLVRRALETSLARARSGRQGGAS
jgi:carbon-monoxide dehydrogenase medium subunit